MTDTTQQERDAFTTWANRFINWQEGERARAWEIWQAARATPQGAEPVAEGWRSVPLKMTEEMHQAAVRTLLHCSGNDDFPPRVYRAMLNAAPHPPEPKLSELQAEPSPGLLMSMAMRYDHALGMPGFYESELYKGVGGRNHAQRLASTLSTMRQLWEEVTGNGFYKPELEDHYAELARQEGSAT